MAERPMVGARVSPELKQRIKRLSERDCIPESHVVRDMLEMAADAREAWRRPKVELPKPTED